MACLRTIITVAMVCATALAGVSAAAQIQWFDWNEDAFATAHENDRLIMVNVGHEGCTACRFMDANTFTNAAVIAFLNEHFISIQVDSEARPDIGERYSDWAWPATVFLRPDATQVTALRGSMRPARFLPILEDLVDKHAAGALDADQRAPYAAPRTPLAGPLDGMRRQVYAQLDRGFDDEIGGWGQAKVLEYAEPTLQFLLRGHLYNDAVARERGLKNARGFARQVDEVWGGVFYASFKSWDNSVKEKRTESQAAGLQIFAAALKITGEPVFLDRIALIDRYLSQHMRADNGLYYASQKDMIAGRGDVDFDDYYALGDAERRHIGLPSIDHALYTDLNARVLEGYVHAFEATGLEHYLGSAISIAQTLVTERQTQGGWLAQLKTHAKLERDRRVHVLNIDERPFLRTQAYAGRALLALYGASADPRWLRAAERIAAALRKELEGPTTGGFYAAPADGTERVIGRRKPLEDNAVAAQFLFLLGVLTKDSSLQEAATRAVRAAALPSIVRREGRITGNLALALDYLSAGYVEFSVLGSPDHPRSIALMNAARSVFEPRKLVHFEAPGRYPNHGKPALYICNEDACSLPIFDAANVTEEAAKFVPFVFARAN